MSHRISIKPRFIALALGSALAACSNDIVDLGGGTTSQSIEVGSTCAESVIVEGDVRVKNQAELDALLGCEEIRGGLRIDVFEDTDLTPLGELKAIDGVLIIGGFPDPPISQPQEAFEAWLLENERFKAIAEANWLPSLAGVESLERIGGLSLLHISAPSLDAFESLRLVTGSGGSAAHLSISAAPNLLDLTGLENARGFGDLELRNNQALESLNGLHVGPTISGLHLQDDPALTNINALAPLTEVAFVYITGTGLPNLDALANLSGSFGLELAVTDSPELTSVDGLAGIAAARYLVFERNPKLERLPEFPDLAFINGIKVVDNPALESLSLNFPNVNAIITSGGFEQPLSDDMVQILGNDKLTSVTFGAGWGGAAAVLIGNNASLTSIDLGKLRSIDSLLISNNASLTAVTLDALQTVDSLSVTGNPLLSTTELRTVRTFESEFIDNADDPPPAP
jgi:hypothetical protein